MEELVKTFHIDWRLMVAQLVNFAIVVAVLWRFALKPLMKTMRERTLIVEKSLHDAEEIERRMKETENVARQRITEARAQALAILNEAKKQAEAEQRRLMLEAKQKVEKIIAAAKQQIQHEKEEMVRDARGGVADLVVTGLRKILGKTVSQRIDKDIIKEEINRL